MSELDYYEIGKRIKKKRNELHLTQEKLSELIDVSPSYVSEIERGTSISSLATISKLATVLNLGLDYLVYGVTPENADFTFSEILSSIPEKNHKLYFDLCRNIAKSLSED